MAELIDGKELSKKIRKDLKKEVANLVVEKVSTIQEKYNELLKSDKLEEILNDGIEAVRPMAKKKYEIMKQKIGLGIK